MGVLEASWTVEIDAPRDRCYEIAADIEGAPEWQGTLEDVDPTSLERSAIPVGRPGHAEEIAAAIAFLASPGASYATGASFVIDGGMLLMAAVANQDG